LGEENNLRVFENRVLRRIFGPKRDVDISWRKLHNDELHSLYSSPNFVRVFKSRKMRWAGLVACMGEGRAVYRVLVGRPGGKRPLGRPRRRWEDNINLNLRDVGIDGTNWNQLAQLSELQCDNNLGSIVERMMLWQRVASSVSEETAGRRCFTRRHSKAGNQLTARGPLVTREQ
jgi:hypothetical protein